VNRKIEKLLMFLFVASMLSVLADNTQIIQNGAAGVECVNLLEVSVFISITTYEYDGNFQHFVFFRPDGVGMLK
jgi:hypothetical protein